MLFALFLLAAIALFALTARLLHWRPIDSWRNFHQRWSTWLHLTGIANLLTYLPLDPRSGLSLWNAMPVEVQHFVPRPVLLFVGLAFWIAAWTAQYVAQAKLQVERAQANG